MKKIFSLFTSLFMAISMVGILPVMTASAGNGLYWPVPGHTNLSQGYHDGYCIDISDGSIAGAKIVAAKGGTVYKKFTCPTQHNGSLHTCSGFGTGLIIKGDDGRYYGYGHMQGGSIPSNVYVGAYVSGGQKIGQVGKTGFATGNHLHFYCGKSAWKGDIQISKKASDYNGGHVHSYSTHILTAYYTKKGCSCGSVTHTWGSNYVDLGDDFYAHIENTQHHNYLNNIDGNVVSKWFTNWNSKMTWRFKKQSNGYYVILNCYDGKALDVYNAGSKSGANVWTYPENGTDAQLWRIYGTKDAYVLKPKCSNCVLDLAGNTITDGANIQIYEYNLTGSQKYSINKHNHELYMPNNWTITKAATCTNQGNKEKKCTCCGYIKKATIPAIGHKYTTTVVAPTTTSQGYTLHKCSVCGDSYKDNETLANVSGFKVSSTTGNTISFVWNNINGVTGYIVYRDINGTLVGVGTPKTNSFTDKNLSPKTSYKYAIRAYKTVNSSKIYSAKLTKLKTSTKAEALASVSGFKVAATSAQAVKLTCNKVAGATGYVFYRAISGKWVRVGVTKTNAFYEGKLNSGTSYRYAVKAYKTVNGKNYYSSSYPTLWTSTRPVSVTINVTTGTKKATVSWNKIAGATGYKVYYKDLATGDWTQLTIADKNTFSYTKTGLTSGKTYGLAVQSIKVFNGKTYSGKFVAKSVKVK